MRLHLARHGYGIMTGLVAGVAALAGPLGTTPASADYPDRPVKILVPYAPGGVADVSTRMVAQKLSERLKQQFVIDNRPGAGGITASLAAAQSAPDGYTLVLTGNGTTISDSLFKTKPYDLLRDFTSISVMAQFDMLLAARSDTPHGDVTRLVAFAKANPGKLNFGTIASGSTQHLSAELFKGVTGVEAAMVTFRGTPDLITALLRGDVDVGFDYLAAFAPALQDSKLKIIASAGERRSPQLADVPTVKEGGYPEYVVSAWNALSAPMGTPPDIIAKLNRETNEVLKERDIQERGAQFGMEMIGSTSDGMLERLKSDIVKWRKVIDKLGLAK